MLNRGPLAFSDIGDYRVLLVVEPMHWKPYAVVVFHYDVNVGEHRHRHEVAAREDFECRVEQLTERRSAKVAEVRK